MHSAAYVLARNAVRRLPEGLTVEERALRALHVVVREASGAVLRVLHEDAARAVPFSANEPVKDLGKVAVILAGVSPKAEDYAVTDQSRGAYILVEPITLRADDRDGSDKSMPRHIARSERFLKEELVLRHHDLLVSLVGGPSILLVDDELADRAVPANTVALVRFRETRRKPLAHQIAAYLASVLPQRVKQLRAAGRLRLTLKDLESLPIPVRLLGKK